jgi:hypothetical protein
MKMAHGLAQFYYTDVAFIIRTRKDDRYYTYSSTGIEFGRGVWDCKSPEYKLLHSYLDGE